jgi:hypothetical protein
MNLQRAVLHFIQAVGISLLGTAFFFVIIGVFGVCWALTALAVFISCALLTYRIANGGGVNYEA